MYVEGRVRVCEVCVHFQQKREGTSAFVCVCVCMCVCVYVCVNYVCVYSGVSIMNGKESVGACMCERV